jgi:hypothetical protein
MELSKYEKLSKEILDNPNERYCEIYKIINLTTGKIYVGDTKPKGNISGNINGNVVLPKNEVFNISNNLYSVLLMQ